MHDWASGHDFCTYTLTCMALSLKGVAGLKEGCIRAAESISQPFRPRYMAALCGGHRGLNFCY